MKAIQRRWWRGLLPVVLAAASPSAWSDIPVPNLGTPGMMLGEVLVTAAYDPFSPGLPFTSVDLMDAPRVADKHVMNSWELMGQMPGIHLTEFRMGAESGKPSFRAFNGEGYINGIKLLIDGVPSHVNSGNLRYLDMLFPLEIERIEVVRGTNDPRYGLHNIAGNINVMTRQGGNHSEARFTAGSFGTHELQASLAREANGLAQNYFFTYQAADGFRDHSASEKYSFAGKWFLTPEGGRLRTGLVVRSYRHDAQDPGYLTASELEADRWQSPARNANDRSAREMHQISMHIDDTVTPSVFWTSKLYVNAIKDDRYVTFTSNPAGTAPRQRRFWEETHFGLLSAVSWRASGMLTLDGGINLERQQNHYQRYRFTYALPTDFSTPASTSNNEDYTVGNVGAFVQAVLTPAEKWRIVPALRVDRFDGESTFIATGARYSLQDYGWIHQPKLSIVYSPSQDVSWYANWGKTFQILTGSTVAYRTTATTYAPSINTGYELGIRLRLSRHVDGRIAVWQQDATQEVANLPSADVTRNLGQTRRRGVDFQINAELSPQWRVWASHAVQEARIVGGYSAGGNSLAGKEVFSTPRYLSNVGLDYQASDQLRYRLQGRAQGSYFIDDLNLHGKFGDYLQFDASMRYRLSKTASIDLQLKNIFDRQYAYAWYDSFFWSAGSHQPMFSPGPGRSAFLSLNVSM